MNSRKAKAMRKASGFEPKAPRTTNLFAAPAKRPFVGHVPGSPRRAYQDMKKGVKNADV